MMRFTLKRLALILAKVILLGWLVGCATLPSSPAPAATTLATLAPTAGNPALSYPYPPAYRGGNSALPYPYPNPPTPLPAKPPTPTMTPTIYPSTIEALSPSEMTPELAGLPTPRETPSYTLPATALPAHAALMPKHYLVVSFIDPLHGWLMGSTEWGEDLAFALASSADGGLTWQPLPVPASLQGGYLNRFSWTYGDYKAQLLFSDALHGWLYQRSLFYTADGGQTWQEQPIQGQILQMGRAVAGFDWALEQIGEQLTLWKIAGDSYTSWQKLGDQFPPVRLPLNTTVVDAQNFWISDWTSFQSDIRPIGSRLFVTGEAGKTWSQVSLPPPCDHDPLVLAAVSATEIWMGCGFPAGAGSGISAAFFSGDGGVSWQEKWYSTNGYFTDLRALSRDFVYMTFDYGSAPTISYDGGQTWDEGGFSCITNSPQADFVDEQHGWGVCDSTVNRTVDGGRSWECVELTNTKVCFP